MTKIKNRLDYIDILNILSSFAVVVMHCSGMAFQYEPTFSWKLSIVLQSISHFAVPVFFMITGATLLEYRKKYDTGEFFKKRFLKTGLPFIFWSVFYIFFKYYMGIIEMPTFVGGVKMILSNSVLNIFWFFYEIFGIYLAMPFLSLLAEKKNMKEIKYFVLLFFAFRACLPLFSSNVAYVTGYLIPAVTSGSIGYLFLGYIIKHEDFSKFKRFLIYCFGFLGLLIMIFGTIRLSLKNGKIDKTFFDYMSIGCMPYSAGIMLFIKHLNYNRLYKVIPQKVIVAISSTCFSVYILHMAFIMIRNNIECIMEQNEVLLMTLTPIIVYTICVLISLIVKKIPILKHLMP